MAKRKTSKTKQDKQPIEPTFRLVGGKIAKSMARRPDIDDPVRMAVIDEATKALSDLRTTTLVAILPVLVGMVCDECPRVPAPPQGRA